jgi:hypothetical protein
VAFDQSKIGQLAAGLMDQLEPQYGDDAEIGAIALVLEITSSEHGSQIVSTYSDPRTHVNVGLLSVAERMLTKRD